MKAAIPPSASSAAAAALLFSLAGIALAQSDSPYIPTSGISDKCHDYLVQLDSNTALATCSSALLDATSLFSPLSSSTSTPSTAQINGALTKLCASSESSCDATTIKQALTDFSSNCADELNAGNAIVKSNYDVLYVLSPFTDAVCTKNESGEFCATVVGDAESTSSNSTSANTTSTSSPALVAQPYDLPTINLADLYVTVSDAAKSALSKLRKRQSNTVTEGLLPNATTWSNTGLPFLFLSEDMTSAQLCTSCTKNILAAYVSFESSFPYAIGLANSPLLSSQTDLWKGIGGVCGSGFLTSITSQSGSTVNSGAFHTASMSSMLVVLLAGILAAVFAL